MGIPTNLPRTKMKKIITIASAAVLSVTALGATLAPATAAPYQHQQSQQHPKFESHGDYAYYNGKRGYKRHVAGYRYYNGYWFPPAAFVIGGLIFGTILGGIIASQH